jgi:hypothetical protein
MRLAGGSVSEKEKIEQRSLSEYLQLLKFIVDKTNRETKTPV